MAQIRISIIRVEEGYLSDVYDFVEDVKHLKDGVRYLPDSVRRDTEGGLASRVGTLTSQDCVYSIATAATVNCGERLGSGMVPIRH